jgi:hypothetical protein
MRLRRYHSKFGTPPPPPPPPPQPPASLPPLDVDTPPQPPPPPPPPAAAAAAAAAPRSASSSIGVKRKASCLTPVVETTIPHDLPGDDDNGTQLIERSLSRSLVLQEVIGATQLHDEKQTREWIERLRRAPTTTLCRLMLESTPLAVAMTKGDDATTRELATLRMREFGTFPDFRDRRQPRRATEAEARLIVAAAVMSAVVHEWSTDVKQATSHAQFAQSLRDKVDALSVPDDSTPPTLVSATVLPSETPVPVAPPDSPELSTSTVLDAIFSR